jgi:hypothetical protein
MLRPISASNDYVTATLYIMEPIKDENSTGEIMLSFAITENLGCVYLAYRPQARIFTLVTSVGIGCF